jgi:hypothetical protein
LLGQDNAEAYQFAFRPGERSLSELPGHDGPYGERRHDEQRADDRQTGSQANWAAHRLWRPARRIALAGRGEGVEARCLFLVDRSVNRHDETLDGASYRDGLLIAVSKRPIRACSGTRPSGSKPESTLFAFNIVSGRTYTNWRID